MGTCNSLPCVLARGLVNREFEDEMACSERCPTVFGLELEVAEKRRMATSLYPNLVHVEIRKSMFEVYNMGEKLDTCSRRRVHMAIHRETGRYYMATEVEIPLNRSNRVVRRLWEEFDRQAQLDHPNICRLHEVYCSEERYYTITDLCSGGDLLAMMEKFGINRFEENEAISYMRMIIGALFYGHELGIAHGDLRLEKCLLEHSQPGAQL
ncbi:unnamed protein product, partial [Discosporangium mesarthrocarpum]